MVEIHTQRNRDGTSRTYITHGKRTSVIDGDFTDDADDIKTHKATTPYLYGT